MTDALLKRLLVLRRDLINKYATFKPVWESPEMACTESVLFIVSLVVMCISYRHRDGLRGPSLCYVGSPDRWTSIVLLGFVYSLRRTKRHLFSSAI